MAVLTNFYTAINGFYTGYINSLAKDWNAAEIERYTSDKLNSYLEKFLIKGRDGEFSTALLIYTDILDLLEVGPADPARSVTTTDLQTYFGTTGTVLVSKASLTLTPAQILNGTAVKLLDSPAADKYYIFLYINCYLDYNSTPYTTTGAEAIIVGYTATPNNDKLLYRNVADLLTETEDAILSSSLSNPMLANPGSHLLDDVYIQRISGAPASGNSNVRVDVYYEIGNIPGGPITTTTSSTTSTSSTTTATTSTSSTSTTTFTTSTTSSSTSSTSSTSTTSTTSHTTGAPDLYAGEMICDGDAGDYRGSSTLPDFADVSLDKLNCTDSVSETHSYGGTRSTRIDAIGHGNTYYGRLAIDNAGFKKPVYNIDYRFDFWIYVPSSTSWDIDQLRVQSQSPTQGTKTWYDQAVATDIWVNIACDITMQGDETSMFSIFFTAGEGTDHYYLDNISFKTIYTSLGGEEFTNPDCEAGTPTINGQSWGTYQSTFALSADFARGGSQSMKLTQTTAGPTIALSHLPSATSCGLSGGYYLMSGYFYIPAGEDIAQDDCGLYFDAGVKTWLLNFDQWVGDKATWNYIENVICLDGNTDRAYGIRIMDESVGGGGVVYIDDFSMKKLDLVPPATTTTTSSSSSTSTTPTSSTSSTSTTSTGTTSTTTTTTLGGVPQSYNLVGYGTDSKFAYASVGVDPKIMVVDRLTTSTTDGAAYGIGGIDYKGSLAYCCRQNFPRIILFGTSGTIDYSGVSADRFTIEDDHGDTGYCWIVGSSAPSPGIEIYGAGLFIEEVDDVLVTDITIGIGDVPLTTDIRSTTTKSVCNNVVFNHCTLRWGWGDNVGESQDETTASNYTVSNTLIYQPMQHPEHRTKESGMDPKNALDYQSYTTYYKSLFAFSVQRNPILVHGGSTIMINCYGYNSWLRILADIGELDGPTPYIVYIGNNGRRVNCSFYDSIQDYCCLLRPEIYGNFKMYVDDLLCKRKDDGYSDEECVRDLSGNWTNEATPPLDISAYTNIIAASAVKAYIMNDAGPKYKDMYDTAVLSDINTEVYKTHVGEYHSEYSLPAVTVHWASSAGNVSGGYNWSSNNQSFTIKVNTHDAKTVTLNQYPANPDAVVSHINSRMATAGVVGAEAYKIYDRVPEKYVAIRTTSVGTSEEIIISSSECTTSLDLRNGTYIGWNGLGHSSRTVNATSHTIPANPHDTHAESPLTNLEVWILEEFGAIGDGYDFGP